MMKSDFSIHTRREQIDHIEMDVATSPLLQERCERSVHPSGLVILRVPKTMTQQYAMLVVRYGAGDTCYEVDGTRVEVPTGTAHFLEHKLFARPDGGDANDLFSALGAESNAWTDYDRTAYLFSTTEQVAPALEVLLRFVLTPHFTPDNVVHEQGIIREEILMGEDNPWQQLHEQTLRAVYHTHPFRERICGTVDSISHITAETLYQTHRAFYRPDNMYLVVCGDLTMPEIYACVARAWGDVPLDMAHHHIQPLRHLEPKETKEHRLQTGARVARPMFQITVKDTAFPDEPAARLRREVAMELLGEVLFSRAGQFYSELFESGLLGTDHSYGYSSADGAAYFALAGESDDPDAVRQAYLAALERTRREGLFDADIERCRRVLYADFVAQFDFPDDIAELVCEAEGCGYGIFDELNAISSLTGEELYALMAQMFVPDATVFSVLMPDDTEQNVNKED